MKLNLVADRVIKGRIYPAFARHEGRPYTQSWREFGSHWPYTIPLRLQEYCDHHGVQINIYGINDTLPPNTFYPVGLGFFDFGIDYFELMDPAVLRRLRREEMRVLFYYHEGDNPFRIKDRLDDLACNHLLPPDCYVFVSANTAARSIPGFVYFTDFELWYWQRNHAVQPEPVHHSARTRDFTALVRLHKPWRAMCMADLHRHNVLTNSYWSYCEGADPAVVDYSDSPIEIDSIAKLRKETAKFLAYAPYQCDNLSMAQRNDHSITPGYLHSDSWCNIVLETHFDADGCYGTFLTEKTFKPIKHGQMFFVAGPAGSLDLLRELGYRVFDGILDNSYDTNVSSTLRWEILCESIRQAQTRLPELFEQARADIEHNQQLFLAPKTQRLNNLIRQINEYR